MAVTDEVKILITAEVGKAVDNLKTVQKNIGSMGGETITTTEKLEKFNSKLSSVTGGLIAAGVAIYGVVKGLGGLVDAYAESDRAARLLENAFSDGTENASEATKEFQKFAEQLQEVTKYEDDLIVASAAQLESLTKLDQQGLQKATKAAADLATMMGIDLSSAAIMVGKAISGEVDSIGRYKIEVQKGATESERLAAVLTKVSTIAGGFAESEGQSAVGRFAQLHNIIGNLKEEFGKIITTAIMPFVNIFKGLVEWLIKAPAPLKTFILVFATAIPLVAGLGIAISALKPVVKELGMEVGMALGGIPLVLGGIAAGVTAIVSLIGGSKEKMLDVAERSQFEAAKIRKKYATMNEKNIEEELKNDVALHKKAVDDNLETLDRFYQKLEKEQKKNKEEGFVGSDVEEGLKRYIEFTEKKDQIDRNSLSVLEGILTERQQKTDKANEKTRIAKEKLQTDLDKIEALAGVKNTEEEMLQKRIAALNEYKKQYANNAEVLKVIDNAIAENQKAFTEKQLADRTAAEEKFRAERLKTVETEKGIKDFLKEKELDLFNTKVEAFANEVMLLEQKHNLGLLSEEEYQAALLAVKDKFNKVEEELTGIKISNMINANKKYADSIASTFQMGLDTYKMILDNEVKANDIAKGKELKTLKDQLNSGAISQQEYNDKKTEIEKNYAKKQYALQVQAFNVDKASKIMHTIMNGAMAISNIASVWAHNPAVMGTLIGVTSALIGAQVGLIAAQQPPPPPEFAEGGIMPYSGMAMVGERGPELVNLPAGARVFNNNETNDIMNRNMQIENMTVVANDPQEFFKQMQDYQMQFGRLEISA